MIFWLTNCSSLQETFPLDEYSNIQQEIKKSNSVNQLKACEGRWMHNFHIK